MAAARKLIASGRIPRHEPIVLVITGNGLKTTDALVSTAAAHPIIEPRLDAFERVLSDAAVEAALSKASDAPPPGPSLSTSSGRPAPAAPPSSGRPLT